MPLDPVHVESIAQLAGAIAENVDDEDHDDLARTVWEEWLDPLSVDGRAIVEPLGDRRLRSVGIEDVALTDTAFETVHGLDSGTINPTTFKNGLVLDVAHAAMAAVPSDLDLHRSRSIVVTVHANDRTVTFPEDWIMEDEGYCRRRVLHAPPVNRYAEGVVHALALYLAESEHALAHANTVEELLLLDGPLYPKELLSWRDREVDLRELAEEATPRGIVENYVRLVEEFVDREVPLVGFVKNPATRLITSTLREKGLDAPWADDTALFTRLLERRDPDAGGTGAPLTAEGDEGRPGEDRLTDELTFSSWFVSRGGADRTLAADGDAFGIERRLDPGAYEVTFFLVYDPRDDLLYRIEAPYAFTRDADTRQALTTRILSDVAAARGPPPAIAKADELARISAEEKSSLRRKFEGWFDSESVRTYDDVRWREVE